MVIKRLYVFYLIFSLTLIALALIIRIIYWCHVVGANLGLKLDREPNKFTNLGVNGENVFGQMMLPTELRLANSALKQLSLLVDRLNVALQVVIASEPLGALLARISLGCRLVLLVPGQHVRAKVVLLGKFLTTLKAIKRSDFFVNCSDMLLQVVFPCEAILADVTLPVTALLLLWLPVLAKCDASSCDYRLVGDGIAKANAGVFVLAVQR